MWLHIWIFVVVGTWVSSGDAFSLRFRLRVVCRVRLRWQPSGLWNFLLFYKLVFLLFVTYLQPKRVPAVRIVFWSGDLTFSCVGLVFRLSSSQWPKAKDINMVPAIHSPLRSCPREDLVSKEGGLEVAGLSSWRTLVWFRKIWPEKDLGILNDKCWPCISFGRLVFLLALAQSAHIYDDQWDKLSQ